jgi:hemerythrin superfamily protein
MSIIDKAIAAVTPPESAEARQKARQTARAAATGGGDWLTMILDQHEELERHFDMVKAAGDAALRRDAQRRLGELLMGHAIAEEAVLYPAMAQAHDKGGASMAYTEQVATKMQMAELEALDPMTEEYADKLEHIRGADLHHMYEEEGQWFPKLKEWASADMERRLTSRKSTPAMSAASARRRRRAHAPAEVAVVGHHAGGSDRTHDVSAAAGAAAQSQAGKSSAGGRTRARRVAGMTRAMRRAIRRADVPIACSTRSSRTLRRAMQRSRGKSVRSTPRMS